MANRIQVRRGTTAQWNEYDPTLSEGEIGYNSTVTAFKIGDGSTAWSELDYYQTAASITPEEINAIDISEKGAANGVAELDGSKNLLVPGSSIIIEGTTDNTYETTLFVTDPTADRTITFPNSSGTVTLTSDLSSYAALSGATFTGAITGTDLVLSGDLTVNGTTTTIDTTHLQIEDKNITLAYGNTSDVGADGGGITLLGATNKTFNWVDSTDAWTSSEHMNLVSGKSYKINGTAITAALPALTWGDVKNGTSGLVIS